MESIFTKNTFLAFDVSEEYGATQDLRRTQSFSGPFLSEVEMHTADSLAHCPKNHTLDLITIRPRFETYDPFECEDLLDFEIRSGDVELLESDPAATDATCQTQTSATSVTTQASSFWSSWNISDGAKKAMEERMNGTRCHARLGEPERQTSVRAQLPTLLSPVSETQHSSHFRKPERFTTKNKIAARAKDDFPEKEVVGNESWTCRMIRNIPNDYTRSDLLDLLDINGLSFDFAYLPTDWRKKANLGYAFVNFVSHEEAERCAELLNGFATWKVPSDKVCEVVWGKREQQGLLQNIERFRNCPVMHPDVPEEFKPVLITFGQRTAFPSPTERIKRDRRWTACWKQSSSHAAGSPSEPEPEPQQSPA